jgi:hypothetical protein
VPSGLAETGREKLREMMNMLPDDTDTLMEECMLQLKFLCSEGGDADDFREAFRGYGAGRCLFVTEKGGIGLGPMAMNPGDQISMLFGGRTMFVLRPLSGLNEHFFIGSCYLDGVMKGEVVDMFSNGELSTQWFRLH